jgi:hypothetical protein
LILFPHLFSLFPGRTPPQANHQSIGALPIDKLLSC